MEGGQHHRNCGICLPQQSGWYCHPRGELTRRHRGNIFLKFPLELLYFGERTIYFLAFQILLPRLDSGAENSTVLELANFSTLIIDVPSPDVTMVLKMEPSEDISFMLFLGYKDYPDDENYVAKTRLPLENTTGGKTNSARLTFYSIDQLFSWLTGGPQSIIWVSEAVAQPNDYITVTIV